MTVDPLRISATYRLSVPAHDGAYRAQQLALEQSIEMLAASVTDRHVLDTMVARVDDVTKNGDGTHTARLALSASCQRTTNTAVSTVIRPASEDSSPPRGIDASR